MRLYSLFRKVDHFGKRPTYEKIGSGAYSKAVAIRVYQSSLIADPTLTLRPLKPGTPATPIPAQHVLCPSCDKGQHQCSGGNCACGCQRFTLPRG